MGFRAVWDSALYGIPRRMAKPLFGTSRRSASRQLDSITVWVRVEPPMWRAKGVEWLKRYGFAELAGLCTAIVGSLAARALTGNEIAAAYSASIGENLGYYGVIIGREVVHDWRAAAGIGRPYGLSGAAGTARNLALEFGIAEVLDSGVLRPLLMGFGVRFVGREAGIVVGKLAADLTFYLMVISAYELRRYARARTHTISE